MDHHLVALRAGAGFDAARGARFGARSGLPLLAGSSLRLVLGLGRLATGLGRIVLGKERVVLREGRFAKGPIVVGSSLQLVAEFAISEPGRQRPLRQ